jgi:hypothetical protein
MDINQIIELWRGLSPRLAGAVPGQDLARDEHDHGKKTDGDRDDRRVGAVGNPHEEADVQEGRSK